MSEPVLVTGSSGFVGRLVVQELRNRGLSTIAVGGKDSEDGWDLRNREAVHRLICEHAPAVVVHLAGISSVSQSAALARETWDINFGGTCNLAHACSSISNHIRLVFASSAEVYGASFLQGACNELAPLQPLSPYARSKASAEWFLRDHAAPDLQVLIARPFNHIGAGQDRRFAIPSFAAQIAAAAPAGVVKVGNLEAERDFSHVADLVDALVKLALDKFEPHFGVFNIGSGRTRSVRAILDDLITRSGARIRIEADASRMRPSEIPVAAGQFEAFYRAFGPRKHVPLEVALDEVLDAARARL